MTFFKRNLRARSTPHSYEARVNIFGEAEVRTPA